MIEVYIFEGEVGVSEDQKEQAYYVIGEWSKEGAVALLKEIYGDDWAERICIGMPDHAGRRLGDTTHLLGNNLIEAVADADASGYVYIVRA